MKDLKLEDLTDEQRSKLLDDLKQVEDQKRHARIQKRKDYENRRDKRVKKMVMSALSFTQKMAAFKEMAAELMEEQHAELNEYGEIKTSSKGGFQVVSKDGKFKVVRSRDTDPKWDETAHKGVEILRSFLDEVVRVRQADKAIFEMFMDFLAKNAKGELEYSKVMLFLQHEDKFDDARWKEGLRLLREGYAIEFKKFSYEFFVKDDEGKFVRVPLNFSQL
jgi:Protein of unknown function (DUF3164)